MRTVFGEDHFQYPGHYTFNPATGALTGDASFMVVGGTSRFEKASGLVLEHVNATGPNPSGGVNFHYEFDGFISLKDCASLFDSFHFSGVSDAIPYWMVAKKTRSKQPRDAARRGLWVHSNGSRAGNSYLGGWPRFDCLACPPAVAHILIRYSRDLPVPCGSLKMSLATMPTACQPIQRGSSSSAERGV